LAEMQFAESEFGRVQSLYDRSAIPKQEHEIATLALRTKTEDYRAAKFAEEQPVPNGEDGLLNVFAEGAVPLHTT